MTKLEALCFERERLVMLLNRRTCKPKLARRYAAILQLIEREEQLQKDIERLRKKKREN